ncbi:MAG: hypothetical protein ACFFDK_18770 [Promethearchaeota archaeon]
MNNMVKWQFKESFPSNRERMIQFLICELIFLDKRINLMQNEKEKKLMRDLFEKIENLLDIQQKDINRVLSKKEYERIINQVYKMLKKISNNIAEVY